MSAHLDSEKPAAVGTAAGYDLAGTFGLAGLPNLVVIVGAAFVPDFGGFGLVPVAVGIAATAGSIPMRTAATVAATAAATAVASAAMGTAAPMGTPVGGAAAMGTAPGMPGVMIIA